MNIVLQALDPLVFRDGRPFGKIGNTSGGLLRWPMPSTIAGMIRTRVGLSRDPQYFNCDDPELKSERIMSLMDIRIGRILPVWRKSCDRKWEFMFPKPEDALVTKSENDACKLRLNAFTYDRPDPSRGCNIHRENWLIPMGETLCKPASPQHQPLFWNQDLYMRWLMPPLPSGEMTFDQIGRQMPEIESRVHNSIDPATGATRESHLFISRGIRMESFDPSSGFGEFGIAVAVHGIGQEEVPAGFCHLGGDRKIAFIAGLETPFPECPAGFDGARYLRLILTTPGNFGGWAPAWLMGQQDGNPHLFQWSTIPGTDFKVRLCSAFVPRWIPVSGWDYIKRGPKAMQKLVPAGSVYVVEVENPDESRKIAEHLWGASPGEGLTDADGFGSAVVGRLDIN